MSREQTKEGQPEGPHSYDDIWIWATRLSAVIIIVFICWLFHRLCSPTPTGFEQAVFYTLMLLVFLEAVYAGWLDGRGSGEA